MVRAPHLEVKFTSRTSSFTLLVLTLEEPRTETYMIAYTVTQVDKTSGACGVSPESTTKSISRRTIQSHKNCSSSGILRYTIGQIFNQRARFCEAATLYHCKVKLLLLEILAQYPLRPDCAFLSGGLPPLHIFHNDVESLPFLYIQQAFVCSHVRLTRMRTRPRNETLHRDFQNT